MKTYTRREFSKLSVVAAAGAFAIGARSAWAVAPLAPDASKINGVQIGLNVPYSFSNPKMTNEGIWTNCIEVGIGAVELRTQPVEIFLGAPEDMVFPPKGFSSSDAKANAEKLAQWRKTVSVDRAKDLRKSYENAGVLIQIVKVDGIFNMSDGELDYVFNLAKALGGRAISTEISKKEDDLKRVGSFADKHEMMVGYHGHAETRPEHWEKAFALAKFNGANVDLGHFVAGNNTSPIPFIKEHHARITHVHVKDRKMHNGANTPFGEGDTPIKEVLQLLRENKWPIQATIEFEYKVPEGSTRMTEIARAVSYCRNALS
jgi:sugar phosphate isomerase/epimerase